MASLQGELNGHLQQCESGAVLARVRRLQRDVAAALGLDTVHPERQSQHTPAHTKANNYVVLGRQLSTCMQTTPAQRPVALSARHRGFGPALQSFLRV